jgi:hypothetical protein
MFLMNDALAELVKKKVVEPTEAYAKAFDKTALLNTFRKNNVDTSWAPKEAAPAGSGPA